MLEIGENKIIKSHYKCANCLILPNYIFFNRRNDKVTINSHTHTQVDVLGFEPQS